MGSGPGLGTSRADHRAQFPQETVICYDVCLRVAKMSWSVLPAPGQQGRQEPGGRFVEEKRRSSYTERDREYKQYIQARVSANNGNSSDERYHFITGFCEER